MKRKNQAQEALGGRVAAGVLEAAPDYEFTAPRFAPAGVVLATSAMKSAELARLAAGLSYISAFVRPLVAGTLAADVEPYAALAVDLYGPGIAEDDSLQLWLTRQRITGTLPTTLTGAERAARVRALGLFFGGLHNAISYKLGDGPLKRVVFAGRWREDGPWLVLWAEISE